MPTRSDIVHRIMTDWIGGLREHAAPDFAIDGGGIRFGMLQRTFFPDLKVSVEEILELDADRVFARMTVRSRDRPDATRFPAVAIFTFTGHQVTSIWSVADHTPWMAEVGVLDLADLDRRFDAEIAARERGEAPGGAPPTS